MIAFRRLAFAALLATGLSGCAGIQFINRGVVGSSSIYASTGANEYVNDQTRLGSKSGEGCATSIFGLITTGDVGVGEIARKANISRVTHIDNKFENILGLYAKYCTTVYGD